MTQFITNGILPLIEHNFVKLDLVNPNELTEKIESEIRLQVLEHQACIIAVNSENDAKQALSMALQARKLEKILEEGRSEISKPHFDYQKDLNKVFKGIKEKLLKIQESLQGKIQLWMDQQLDNPFTMVSELTVEDGKLYQQEEWGFDVIHDQELPREYLKVDENMIEQAIREGVRNIPGVSIYREKKTKMRIKN